MDSQYLQIIKEVGSLGVIFYMLRILERLVRNGITVRVIHPEIKKAVENE